MIKELFINLSILISSISLFTQWKKEYDHIKINPYTKKLIIGVLNGILGVGLIYFGCPVYTNSIIDFRNMAIIIAAIYGGGLSIYVCSIMIVFFRIAYFGVNISSVYGVILIIVSGSANWVICNKKLRLWQKWAYCTSFNTVAASIALIINYYNAAEFKSILAMYIMSSIIVSSITYKYLEYCFSSNRLYVKLVKESSQDFLTGLNNLRQFNIMMKRLASNALDKEERLSLLVIDVDHFKHINDTYGHANGDIVLKEMANIFVNSSRSFDVISRNGGEEFTVILLDCDRESAIRIGEKIRKNVEQYRFILSDENEVCLTVSIGVASFPESTKDIKRLYELADNALYKSKRDGRNKVSYI
ncbi:diguanylate cyclase [Clostridium manihotivorum]|uniref:GGDEF domain-containing protein n=1 Tax=Clostridium manihotivorum TaxID=2320868 RepID=A0A410E1A6_9CLOT|nr:diguanylate cyclase [Clostridium manihotivorum]QAA35132.1 GGDEF domain-containing protein [Clostridium manihotivorum]